MLKARLDLQDIFHTCSSISADNEWFPDPNNMILYRCHSENGDIQSIYRSLANNLGDFLPRKKIFKSWHRLNYKQCPHTPISHSSSRPPLYALWQQRFLHYQRIWRETLINHVNFLIISMYGLDQIFYQGSLFVPKI